MFRLRVKKVDGVKTGQERRRMMGREGCEGEEARRGGIQIREGSGRL